MILNAKFSMTPHNSIRLFCKCYNLVDSPQCCNADCRYTECSNVEVCYAECRCDGCRYTKCRGAPKGAENVGFPLSLIFKTFQLLNFRFFKKKKKNLGNFVKNDELINI